MDLSPYADALRIDLASLGRATGPDAEELLERLSGPLDAAVRLVIQEAVSDAAQEISRELAPGSVDVRLRGRDLGFVVTPAPEDATGLPGPRTEPREPESPREGTEVGTARLTVQGRDCPVDITELPDGCPVLIGPIPLEAMDFVVDMPSRRLVGNPDHGGEHVIELY